MCPYDDAIPLTVDRKLERGKEEASLQAAETSGYVWAFLKISIDGKSGQRWTQEAIDLQPAPKKNSEMQDAWPPLYAFSGEISGMRWRHSDSDFTGGASSLVFGKTHEAHCQRVGFICKTLDWLVIVNDGMQIGRTPENNKGPEKWFCRHLKVSKFRVSVV